MIEFNCVENNDSWIFLIIKRWTQYKTAYVILVDIVDSMYE